MLSVAKCRKILGDDCFITDAEIEQMRNSLYDLAHVVVESMPPQRRRGCSYDGTRVPPSTSGGVTPRRCGSRCRDEASALLAEEERYVAEERAAILEFGG